MSTLSGLFTIILNMSITASYVAVGIILVRLLLRKAPKIFSYALWAVVLFRLICPLSFTSAISFLGLLNINSQNNAGVLKYVSNDIGFMQEPTVQSGIGSIDSAVNSSLPQAAPIASVNPMQIWMDVLSLIWLAGIIALLLYSVISYIKIKRQLLTATLVKGNIYESDRIGTAFVCGFINPKIYVPVGVGDTDLSYILEHERMHIRRKDYLIKPLAFFALILHWFNPLMWLSFALMNRDMEMSCDESVLQKMSQDDKGGYSSSLLSLSVKRNGLFTANPLAFGESHVKARIKNVLNYKKPRFWIVAFSIIIVTAVGAGLMSDPKAEGIIGGADGPGVVLAVANNITLCANDGTEDGMYQGITVQTKDKIKAFSWLTVTNPTYAPTINVIDADADGKDEVIIILTTGYGTNVLQQEIHVLNMEDLSEISIQNPIKAINKKATSTITKNEGKVNAVIKWDGKVIEKSYYESEAGIWFDEVTFGSIITYEIIDNKITATVPGAVSPSEFPVTAFIEYGSDLKVDTIAILEQNKDVNYNNQTSFDAESNLDIIMSSPKTSSNPQDYINAHKNEYENFFKYGGEDALQYMLSQFEAGNAEGLRGQIMMQLCKELLGARNNVTDESLSPQEWYDALDIRQEIKLPNFVYDGQDSIEKLVYDTEIEKNSDPKRGGFTVVAPKIFGSYEEEDLLKVFITTHSARYKLFGNALSKEGGSIVPAAITYRKDENGRYILEEYEQTGAGSEFGPSIRNFCTMPVSGKEIKGLADKILKHYVNREDIRILLHDNLFNHLKKNGIEDATLTNSQGEVEFTMINPKYKP